ncbi:MAG TPA: S1/P1 nuclease [Candidatus Acidoferrum sp.]|nr:S1/P1 nuclease [Candidatus Acidoferrum sp.]
MKRFAAYPIALAVLLGFGWAPVGRAWGCKGHQTIALVAEKYLTPEARQFVSKLLSDNPVDPKLRRYCGEASHDAMVDASTWADDVRSERKNGPWHYIDIPRGAKHGPLEPYCGNEGCLTSAITEQLAILKDKNADPPKRAEALRYIIHFAGDLHQPLHDITNDDEGGNCVPLKYLRRNPRQHNHSFSPNLHSIWDTAIPERDAEGADPAEYAETLESTFATEIPVWQKAGIHVDDWAWEGFDLAENVVYGALSPQIPIEKPAPVRSCADDNNIGDRMLAMHIRADEAYQEKAAAVAEKRIVEGGVRLAMLLNESVQSLATPD